MSPWAAQSKNKMNNNIDRDYLPTDHGTMINDDKEVLLSDSEKFDVPTGEIIDSPIY